MTGLIGNLEESADTSSSGSLVDRSVADQSADAPLEQDPAFSVSMHNPLLDLREFMAKRTYEMKGEDYSVALDDIETTGYVLPVLSSTGEIISYKLYSAEPRRNYVTEIPSLSAEMIFDDLLNFGRTGNTGLRRATITLGLGTPTLSATDDEENTLTLIFDSVTDPDGTAPVLERLRAIGKDEEVMKKTFLRVYEDPRGFTALVMAKDKFFKSYETEDPMILSNFQYTGLLGAKRGAIQAGFIRLPIDKEHFLRDFFKRTSGLASQLDIVAVGLQERKIVTPEYIANLAKGLNDLLFQDIADKAQVINFSTNWLGPVKEDEKTHTNLTSTIAAASDTQGLIVQFLRNINAVSPVHQRVDLFSEISFMAKLFQAMYADRTWNLSISSESKTEEVTTIPYIAEVLLFYLAVHAIRVHDSKVMSLGIADDGDLMVVNFVWNTKPTDQIFPMGVVPADTILPDTIVPILRYHFRNIYVRINPDSTEVSFAIPTTKSTIDQAN